MEVEITYEAACKGIGDLQRPKRLVDGGNYVIMRQPDCVWNQSYITCIVTVIDWIHTGQDCGVVIALLYTVFRHFNAEELNNRTICFFKSLTNELAFSNQTFIASVITNPSFYYFLRVMYNIIIMKKNHTLSYTYLIDIMYAS